MFTGLIESLGHVAEVEPTASGFRVRISTAIAGELALGESVSVNGVCLTVVGNTAGSMHADVAPETARVTTLGHWLPDRP
jgi:riboflavin synthase